MASVGVSDEKHTTAHAAMTAAISAANNAAAATSNTNGTPLMEGVNAELLMGMMNCVDTSLFSPQQLHNWQQMVDRIKQAAEQKTPLMMPTLATVNEVDVKNETATTGLVTTTSSSSSSSANGSEQSEYRQPLHREASIQDVLSCLLDQQPPSVRMMNSSGGSFLLNSEVKNRAQLTDDNKPTLKSLLSSNDFTMTEKKESLRHLLSFIDTSFASSTEPLTQVYKDAEDGKLQRLSSLQLMRSFMTPNGNQGTQLSAMGGRTTSFEIIQAMLNATSNQVIQKPMTSQDSFRFQHLARTLEAIETDVAYDNEDYGGDEVVQVDNLDNLLDYHGPGQSGATASTTGHAQPPAPPSHLPTNNSNNGMNLGFVDTQELMNPSRSIYNEIGNGGMGSNGVGSYQTYGQLDQNGMQNMYGQQQTQLPSVYNTTNGQYPTQSQVDMMNNIQQGMNSYSSLQSPGGMGMADVKLEPTATTQQQMLQQQLLAQEQQQQQQQQTQQFNQMHYQSTLLTPQANEMIMTSTGLNGYGGVSQQQQNYSNLMMQHSLLPQPQQQRISAGLTSHLGVTSTQVKQSLLKKDGLVDANGGAQICSALGCNHVARVKGMCKLHGGGRRCKVEGCMKSAQTGHLCIAHGGGKPCHVEGCPKTAQSRGLCKQHGGGVRCKFEGCTKSCQSGGFCRGHGGGKRCEYPNCTKWAQKNGHCAKHAQELAHSLQQQLQVHP